MRSPSSFLCVRCRSHVTVCDTHSEVTHTLIYVKCMSRVTHLCEVHESCYLCKVQELCYCVCVCVCEREWRIWVHRVTNLSSSIYAYIHIYICTYVILCVWVRGVCGCISIRVTMCITHSNMTPSLIRENPQFKGQECMSASDS